MIPTIVVVQSPTDIPPYLRSCAEYVFLAQDQYIQTQRRMYEQYAGMIPTFSAFQTVCNQLTQDYSFLVIDKIQKNANILEKVMWYNSNYSDVDPEIKNDLHIQQIDFNSMNNNPSICVIGKRGTGRTTLCDDLAHFFRDTRGIYNGIIVNPQERFNSFYSERFPTMKVCGEVSDTLINTYLYRQRRITKRTSNCKSVAVFDDCFWDRNLVKKSTALNELLFNGRHYNISYIATIQNPLTFDKLIRNNFDYIFIFAEDFVSNQKRIYDHYCGMFPDFPTFQKVFKELTRDHGCMVIVNRGDNKTFNEKVFWYKALFRENKECIEDIANVSSVYDSGLSNISDYDLDFNVTEEADKKTDDDKKDKEDKSHTVINHYHFHFGK